MHIVDYFQLAIFMVICDLGMGIFKFLGLSFVFNYPYYFLLLLLLAAEYSLCMQEFCFHLLYVFFVSGSLTFCS